MALNTMGATGRTERWATGPQAEARLAPAIRDHPGQVMGAAPLERHTAPTEGGWAALLAQGDVARPLRFAITGGIAGVVQLALLALLTHAGWAELPANALAFLLAAQLNFALSSAFTWRDRRADRALGRRWLAFHGSIAAMAVVNMLVFALARAALPTLLASALGIAAAACGNFMLGDRLVFRRATPAQRTRREEAA